MLISGWGNYPRAESEVVSPAAPRDAAAACSHGPVIARGAGRAYGDAAIGLKSTVLTRNLDRFLAFDPSSRELTVEAGTMLSDVIDFALPRGFFPPVVPGTINVSVGGMVASNVHGKNHHKAGGFGRHLARLKVALADGTLVSCDPANRSDLFRATIGGMGLTGLILEATFRLIPVETGFMRQETLIAPELGTAMRLLEESNSWSYSVAWIDGLARGSSLGRAIIFRAEHARADEVGPRLRTPAASARASLAVPFELPSFTLNRISVRVFNECVYLNGRRRQGHSTVPISSFFFPLDSVSDWNRVYGRPGFIQYQCVVPKARAADAVAQILDLISRRGSPSFLAVLKLLGPDEDGWMSFPMEGYTLAIDFPANAASLKLAGDLDRLVAAAGGRLYLAKDARQAREMLEQGYPNTQRFRAFRKEIGASGVLRSLQSERLGL